MAGEGFAPARLDRDPALQAPDLAIRQIERRAGDIRFVSVLVLAQGESLLGRRHYWPVWQAAEKHKLPRW